MNILIITPSWNPRGNGAGLTSSIKPVISRLVESGHSLTILTSGSNYEKNAGNIDVIRIYDKSARFLQGFSFNLIYFLFKNQSFIKKFDIIHLHSYASLFAFSAIVSFNLLKTNTPIIFTPHYHEITDSKVKDKILNVYNKLAKNVFNRADRIISVSNYEATILKKTFKINDNKICVIAHGVSETPSSGKLKHKNNSDRVNLLYVGRLVRHKGVQYIPKGMRILKDNFNLDSILDIVGPGGPTKNDILCIAKDLNLDKNIIWNGYLSEEDLTTKYETADIFILLSWAEAYGLVVADALAMGVPCIVANTSALTEFVKEPGCFGIEFPPDPEKLASLIFKIHRSDIKVGPFSEYKIRTWDKVGDDYIDLYSTLL